MSTRKNKKSSDSTPTYPEAIIKCGRSIFWGIILLALIGLATYGVDKAKEVAIIRAQIHAQMTYEIRMAELNSPFNAPSRKGGPGS
jgi:hypothetical protein